MIAQQAIKRTFGVEPIVSQPMDEAIELWRRMYENDAPWLDSETQSLNLPAAIASEISRMATIEAIVTVEGGTRAKFLQEQMQKVLDDLREQIEYGVALGGMVLKPYLTADNTIAIEYVKATDFIPVEFDMDGTLVGAIFVDKRKIDNWYYTKLEYHQMQKPTGCMVSNAAFRSSSPSDLGSEVPLEIVPAWADIVPTAFISGIDRPLFAYFKTPAANSIDPTSRLGTSVYSRATEMIEEADEIWSNFIWEFESGKRALYVDVLAFKRDDNGNPILPNRRLYRTIDAGGSEDALFEDWSPTFRQIDLLAGLNAVLKRIEFACGLAYGTLSDPAQIEKTATEILSARQRTYAMITDMQKSLDKALKHLTYAVDVWASLGNLAPSGAWEVEFTFDDSMIVDKESQFRSDMVLVSSGIMSKIEFRMRNFKEDEATAKARVAMATQEVMAAQEAAQRVGGYESTESRESRVS